MNERGSAPELRYAGLILWQERTRLSAIIHKGTQEADEVSEAAFMLTIQIDRDTVHASDDGEARAITIDPGANLGTLFQSIQQSGYLPGISGGEATWIIESSGGDANPLGVYAEQWPEPKLIVSPDTTLEAHFGIAAPTLYFRYWCQADPDLVFAHVQAGKELPPRY